MPQWHTVGALLGFLAARLPDCSVGAVRAEDVWSEVKSVISNGILATTYATEARDGFCLTAFSELYHGLQPVLLGLGRQDWPHLRGLSLWRHISIDKLRETRAFVEWVVAQASRRGDTVPLIFAHDGGDTVFTGSGMCLHDGYKRRAHPIVWLAERWFYLKLQEGTCA
eukprot:TRINITY_DN18564_c0_g1_i10.p4 TRINITY_DN18564_c0_g1~~TRINITY_DN18564_c0_g1_i10.p4  ORF type:complete len:168 (+),score=12.16 TRINITY_DN18564_c0_g1_i10:119-622(+)